MLENLAFETLGLNSRSTVHALMIAVLLSISFVTFIWMIDEYEIVPAGTASGAISGATEELLSTGGNNSNPITQQVSGSTKFGHPIVIAPTNFF